MTAAEEWLTFVFCWRDATVVYLLLMRSEFGATPI